MSDCMLNGCWNVTGTTHETVKKIEWQGKVDSDRLRGGNDICSTNQTAYLIIKSNYGGPYRSKGTCIPNMVVLHAVTKKGRVSGPHSRQLWL